MSDIPTLCEQVLCTKQSYDEVMVAVKHFPLGNKIYVVHIHLCPDHYREYKDGVYNIEKVVIRG